MSGGHFNYDQCRIGYIADTIQEIISYNEDDSTDKWGDARGHFYPPQIIARFREAISALRRAEIMAQRIDWLLSSDDSEESFMWRWDEDLAKLDSSEPEE